MIRVLPGGRWEGLDGMGDEILREIMSDAVVKVRQAALVFVNEIKRTLTGQRHGRTYYIGKTRRAHVASAPGEPPAVLFGNLRNSIGYSEPEWSEGHTVCSSEVGPGLGQAAGLPVDPSRTYARRLELGGMDERGVMIEPRPYMAPTEERVRAALEQILEGA